jgi:hypothetical protein
MNDLSGDHVELDGVVESGKRAHPNGSSFTFYTVRLPNPRCVLGSEDVREVTEIQLAPSENVKLGPLVGRKVHVTGEAFPEHTAWHARPVLVTVTSITSLSK